MLALVLPTAALAADPAWTDRHFNPKAAPDDVVLPMPCGGSMAFRKVTVPQAGPLDDTPFSVGGTDEGLGYAEAAHTAHIAAGFAGGKNLAYFLMAKYEVSELQWEAVMAGTCPQPSPGKRLPKAGTGWIDAITFADRYSTWLRKNALAKLPKDGDEAGFVRLPTEAEWEFAARGGMKLATADLNERTFPMPEGMARYVWFAGSQSANGKPQLTGLLEPNPLGLHDMLGNLDEIVFEPFQLNKLGRLHGQPGGYVVRGGNYLTGEQDIRSAHRVEMPYYDGDQPRRPQTTGFRVVVAAPVLSSADKLRKVQQAWQKLGSVSAAGSQPAADPVEELALIAKAAQDPALKGRLDNLRLTLRANINARDEQRDRAAKASLRLGAFLGRKLADDSKAVDTLAEIHKSRSQSAGPDDARVRGYKEQLDKEQRVLDDNLRYYADTVIRMAEDYGDDVLARQRDILAVELQSLGLNELKPYVERHSRHVAGYRKDRRVARSQWLADWNKM